MSNIQEGRLGETNIMCVNNVSAAFRLSKKSLLSRTMIITEHNEHSGNASLDDGFVLLFRSPHGQEIRKQRPKVMTFPERIESFKMSINKLNFPVLYVVIAQW